MQIVFVHSGLDLCMPQAWREAIYSHSLLASDPRQGIHFIVLLSTPPLPPPVTSPHPSQPVAALPVKTTSECWFARQVQMLDGVSSLGFLCCHLGTPIQARIFSESQQCLHGVSPRGLMWSLPSYILLDKLAWLFWFVTLEFQKKRLQHLHPPVPRRGTPFQKGTTLDNVGFAGLFWDRITLEQVKALLFMTSDGCGILLTDVGNSLITCPRRWTPP